jgi:hypothetical protein
VTVVSSHRGLIQPSRATAISVHWLLEDDVYAQSPVLLPPFHLHDTNIYFPHKMNDHLIKKNFIDSINGTIE